MSARAPADQIKRLTVEQLNSKNNERAMFAHIDDLLKTIDTKIKETHAQGVNLLEYELPENFDIKNMDRREAQLSIYSQLIVDLEKRGFMVRIFYNPPPGGTFLRITWRSALSPEKKKEMEGILASHTVEKIN